jgi:hypothetical protein
LRTYRKNSVPTHSVFYFVPPVSVFVVSAFRIYGNRKGVFSARFCGILFYLELTRIYSIFHRIFNLYGICLEIDMLINLLITNYAF